MQLTTLLVVASMLAPVAQGDVPTPQAASKESLDFKGEGRITRDGDLLPRGEQILQRTLKGREEITAATVIICVGDSPQTSMSMASDLVQRMRSTLAGFRLGYSVSVAARKATGAVCSSGVLVDLSTLPKRGNISEARVQSVFGDVKALVANRDVPLFKGSVVPQASVISTGKGASCTVKLPNGAYVKLRERSRIALSDLGEGPNRRVRRKTQLKLLVGRMWSRLVKSVKSGKSGLEVATFTAVAGVRGTTFQMGTTDEGDESTLAVYGGKVGIAAGGDEKEVPEGYSVVAGDTLGDLEPLPPAPINLVPRDGRFSALTYVRWDPVKEASGYRFELATDTAFLDIKYAREFDKTVLALEAPKGTYYWRVVTLTANGIESKPSKLYRIVFE